MKASAAADASFDARPAVCSRICSVLDDALQHQIKTGHRILTRFGRRCAERSETPGRIRRDTTAKIECNLSGATGGTLVDVLLANVIREGTARSAPKL